MLLDCGVKRLLETSDKYIIFILFKNDENLSKSEVEGNVLMNNQIPRINIEKNLRTRNENIHYTLNSSFLRTIFVSRIRILCE